MVTVFEKVKVNCPIGCIVKSCDVMSFCVTTESTNQNTEILFFVHNKELENKYCNK